MAVQYCGRSGHHAGPDVPCQPCVRRVDKLNSKLRLASAPSKGRQAEQQVTGGSWRDQSTLQSPPVRHMQHNLSRLTCWRPSWSRRGEGGACRWCRHTTTPTFCGSQQSPFWRATGRQVQQRVQGGYRRECCAGSSLPDGRCGTASGATITKSLKARPTRWMTASSVRPQQPWAPGSSSFTTKNVISVSSSTAVPGWGDCSTTIQFLSMICIRSSPDASSESEKKMSSVA
jgi:hypothetical protein